MCLQIFALFLILNNAQRGATIDNSFCSDLLWSHSISSSRKVKIKMIQNEPCHFKMKIREERKTLLCQAILQFIFGDQNFGIELGSCNTKLFIIKLTFHIFLNHSNIMSKSKFMIKTLLLHNHTKNFVQNANPTFETRKVCYEQVF